MNPLRICTLAASLLFCFDAAAEEKAEAPRPRLQILNTRLSGHMEGYDPSKAPTFKWPERLMEAKKTISESARKADE